jgi:hypothetical protein
MISLASALILVAAAEANVDQTSLYFRCSVSSANEPAKHALDVTYFQPAIPGAYPLNIRDPDHLLPNVSVAPPVALNLWPTALAVIAHNPDNRSGRPDAAVLFEPTGPATALVKLSLLRDQEWIAPSHVGTCTYTEGSVAEQEYRKLLSK